MSTFGSNNAIIKSWPGTNSVHPLWRQKILVGEVETRGRKLCWVCKGGVNQGWISEREGSNIQTWSGENVRTGQFLDLAQRVLNIRTYQQNACNIQQSTNKSNFEPLQIETPSRARVHKSISRLKKGLPNKLLAIFHIEGLSLNSCLFSFAILVSFCLS